MRAGRTEARFEYDQDGATKLGAKKEKERSGFGNFWRFGGGGVDDESDDLGFDSDEDEDEFSDEEFDEDDESLKKVWPRSGKVRGAAAAFRGELAGRCDKAASKYSTSTGGSGAYSFKVARVVADVRSIALDEGEDSGGVAVESLPPGLVVAGCEWVADSDGRSALRLERRESHVLLRMGKEHGFTGWDLEADGRLHDYTLLLAVRIARLPSAGDAPLKLFHGGLREHAEHVLFPFLSSSLCV